MRIGRTLAVLGLVSLLTPHPSAADGYIVPFVGANFGGDVGRPLNAAVRDRNRAAVGATLGAMGAGVFGIELDVSYTRSFYPTTGSPAASNNLVTVVPALVIGVPIGGQRGPGLRPFALAGAGLVRRNFDFGSVASVSQNDMAYTLGGGVMGFLSDHLGVRGDIRHVRNFRVDDLSLTGVNLERGTFNFSRATAGLILRF